jgi:hypothetical protein
MKNFLRYLFMLLISLALLCVTAVRYGRIAFPGQVGPRFNADVSMTQRDGIAAQKPQIVLLGDSMVEENVDTPALSEQLGRSVYTISYPGSASALWYLAIKNNIAISPNKPPVLVIMFRDTVLTTPTYRADGKFTQVIDTLAGTEEPLLIQLAYVNHVNPLEMFARMYFPLYEYGFQIRDRADFFIRYLLPRPVLKCGKRCVDAAVLDIFNFRNMIAPTADDPVAQAESILYTDLALDFYGQLDQSFLPEIIHLCKENGIQLVLVRGKTISFSDIPEPAGLSRYMRNLREYLARSDILFVDLEADPRLGIEDYIDRFHVHTEAREIYTQMLADGLKSVLP